MSWLRYRAGMSSPPFNKLCELAGCPVRAVSGERCEKAWTEMLQWLDANHPIQYSGPEFGPITKQMLGRK